MNTALKTNIALSPIGYWPYGVRPVAKIPTFNKDRLSSRSILRLLPLLLVMGLSLAGCSQLATNPRVMKATVNNLLDASYAFLSQEVSAMGRYFADSAAYWNRG